MLEYSLVVFGDGVKYGLNLQGLAVTGFVPTLNLFSAFNRSGGRRVRRCSETRTRETKVKVPKLMLSVTKGVLNLRH